MGSRVTWWFECPHSHVTAEEAARKLTCASTSKSRYSKSSTSGNSPSVLPQTFRYRVRVQIPIEFSPSDSKQCGTLASSLRLYEPLSLIDHQGYHFVVHVPRQKPVHSTLSALACFCSVGAIITSRFGSSILAFEWQFVGRSCPLAKLACVNPPFQNNLQCIPSTSISEKSYMDIERPDLRLSRRKRGSPLPNSLPPSEIWYVAHVLLTQATLSKSNRIIYPLQVFKQFKISTASKLLR
jgi:hypothetical protein